MSDRKEFQCALFLAEKYPDSIDQWPEKEREIMQHAIDRMLGEHPGMSVIEQRSFCIGEDHHQWPDKPPPDGLKFALVLEIAISPQQTVAA